MKKTKLALAVAAASLVSTSAFATNGTNMVGLGAQSAALGGTGVAAYYGAENVVVNPGLIGKAEGTEFSFGGTLFKPSVKNTGMGMGGTSYTSDGDRYVVPSVSLVSRVNDNWTFGIGMYGSSGMGVDYRGVADIPGMGSDMMDAQSNLQIMRFVPTIAYNQDNFGIGFSPILQYGSLDINYDMGGMGAGNTGSGAADDLGLGFSLGGYFDITENLTVAASYTSAINMEYKNQISNAATNMGLAGFNDELQQPAEMKLGVAYNAGKMTYTAEAKRIKWGDAKGYKDFGWEDQNVFALGVRYDADNFWLGAGFNYGKDPIKEQNGGVGTMMNYDGAAINMFNNMFFPAITEKHVSIGGGYSLTKNVNIDGAIVRALENTKTVNTSDVLVAQGMPAGTYTNTTKHSQMAYTVTVRYNF